MAAARKNSLFPPDPHYIPGYEGFVPQYGFQFGETFGKTTFRLLTDPNVRKSSHSLLAPLHKLRFIEDFSGTKREVPDYIPAHPARPSLQSLNPQGSAPGSQHTVAGGFFFFLPSGQRQRTLSLTDSSKASERTPRLTWGLFGGDFSSTKAAAGASLPDPALEPRAPAPRQGPVEERHAPTHVGPGDAAPSCERSGCVPSHPGLRLAYEYEQRISPQPAATPKASEENEGRLPDVTVAGGQAKKGGACQPDSACGQGWRSFPCIPEIKRPVKIEGATLPAVAEPVDAESCNWLPRLDVPNAIQQKAISGYTGYIPRYTWITGVGYIQGVKDAMSEFDRNQFLLRNPVCEFGKRLSQTHWPNSRIYTSAGLIPFYTGFVPTLRHSYALTFGNSTRKAYQKEKRRQACALRKKL
ncbi:ciliary microtubule inner protein 2A [Apteryx mantelli]|uniref:Ciliary microtubule inner protein 2A n=1 Tax=Apteryx mantelli TaxID=2696672 RepID=A0ABM4FKL2_9AVES